MTLAKLAELAKVPTQCDLTPSAWSRIEDVRAIVEAEIARGTPVYGATTGVGALKGAQVDPASIAIFYQRLLTSEAIGIPGPAFCARSGARGHRRAHQQLRCRAHRCPARDRESVA